MSTFSSIFTKDIHKHNTQNHRRMACVQLVDALYPNNVHVKFYLETTHFLVDSRTFLANNVYLSQQISN